MHATVRIHVVTYRRPVLLERALRSLLAQTHANWIAEVLNDDPADSRPALLIDRLNDPRIFLSSPAVHRGGAGNFNHAFRTLGEPFASILEDDNWWEPTFLSTMIAALEARPTIELACGNERIWREEPDGKWTNTGVTIWPVESPDREFHLNLDDKAGSARLCNSALLFRTRNAANWRTPNDIPVDVTEHFRERVVPHPFLLVAAPLVNYAETLHTHRARGPGLWCEYQALLVGSLFQLAPPDSRRQLAARMWDQTRKHQPLRANTLIGLSLSLHAARALWGLSKPRERLRFLLSAGRHPWVTLNTLRSPKRHPGAWEFLCKGSFAKFMAKASDS